MSDNSAANNLPSFTPMTLTSLPSPETLISVATSVIESTEGIILTGPDQTSHVYGDPVKRLNIGYGCQINETNMKFIVAAMLGLKVHCNEGVAIHIVPKPCAGRREAAREASVGVGAGQVLSRVSRNSRAPTRSTTRKAIE